MLAKENPQSASGPKEAKMLRLSVPLVGMYFCKSRFWMDSNELELTSCLYNERW